MCNLFAHVSDEVYIDILRSVFLNDILIIQKHRPRLRQQFNAILYVH